MLEASVSVVVFAGIEAAILVSVFVGRESVGEDYGMAVSEEYQLIVFESVAVEVVVIACDEARLAEFQFALGVDG